MFVYNKFLLCSVRYHRDIVNAIREQDRVFACRLMKEHVLNALEVLRVRSSGREGKSRMLFHAVTRIHESEAGCPAL